MAVYKKRKKKKTIDTNELHTILIKKLFREKKKGKNACLEDLLDFTFVRVLYDVLSCFKVKCNQMHIKVN